MLFFETPHELGMELIHAHGWQRIVHLTAGNGWLAIAGMAMRVPGVYVCFTDTHAKELRQHLARVVFMLMQDPCSNFYDPALVSLVQEAEEHLGKDKEGTPPAKKDSKDPWASSAKKNKKEMPKKGESVKPKKGDSDESEEPPKKIQKVSTTGQDTAKNKKKPTSDEGTSSEWSASEAEEE